MVKTRPALPTVFLAMTLSYVKQSWSKTLFILIFLLEYISV